MSVNNNNNKFIYNYSYEQFVKDARALSTHSDNVFTICEEPILHTVYVKCMVNTQDNTHVIEMNILFSESYQMPCLYFTIYTNNTFVPVTYMQFKSTQCIDDDISKYCVITKDNHPFTGKVHEYMHLCQLNMFLHDIPDVRNTLYFWCSVVFQMFNVDLLKLLPFKNLIN